MKTKIMVALLAIGAAVAYAEITQTSQSIDPLITRERLLETDAVKAYNSIVVDIASVAAVLDGLVAIDTNANVSVTLTVPARVGQILIAPNGTNLYAAIARGTTTNDWVTIAQP